MNNARRKLITTASETIDEMRQEIDTIANDEQEAFDSMPEGLQGSDRGQAIEDNAMELQEVVTELEDIRGRLEEILMK